jgi:hypothetical protein
MKNKIFSKQKLHSLSLSKIIVGYITIAIVLLFMPVNFVHANSNANVLQTYVEGQNMTVFANVRFASNRLRVAISNQSAEIIETGTLLDERVLIKTTILIDISASMPSNIQGSVIDLLNTMVEHKPANEEFKLVVFGEELVTLHEFTTDRFDLTNAIGRINFDNRHSRIYEALFNTIPRLERVDERPTFYRTIVITDGVNNSASGITREELFHRLQNEHYPIEVVSVSGIITSELNRELSAISRISGGRYFSLNEGSDINGITSWLSVRNFSYFEAIVPPGLLDGTTRQVDISDDMYNIILDVRFPAWNVPIPDTSEEEINDVDDSETNDSDTDIGEPEQPPELITPPLVDEEVVTDYNVTIFRNRSSVVFIITGIALIIAAAVFIAITVTRQKKNISSPLSEESVSPDFEVNEANEETEFISDDTYSNSQYTLTISKTNDSSETWTLAVVEDLIIGRGEHCHIRLDDKSVSREQCKIAVEDVGLAVVHLGSTNKTILNGSKVAHRSPLQSGDTIKMGREVLRIDYIQSLGNPDSSLGSGDTESIFEGNIT